MAYFFKRLLLFIPTIWLIAVIIFFLTKLSPGNPILNQLQEQELQNKQLQEEELQLVKKYGFNKALFYFTIHRKTIPDTIHRIWQEPAKSNLTHIAFECRNWSAVHHYYSTIKSELKQQPSSYNKLIQSTTIKDIKNTYNSLNIDNKKIEKTINQLNNNQKSFIYNYIPTFSWQGFDNQFHLWLSGLLNGNFGYSYVDDREISTKISQSIQWTLLLSLLSILLAFIIAIPTALKAAKDIDGSFDRIMSSLFLGMYSLPTFWVGTLLIIYFANQEYLAWFPAYGVGEIHAESSFYEITYTRVSHLFLPLVCWTYGSFAYIFKQLQNSLKIESEKAYFIAAKAKGVSTNQLYIKHALRNALLPLITIVGNIFPAVISGSFIIETIFSIPGMGRLSLEAFFSRDYPLIFTILLLASFLSLLGNFIADILYQKADPRFNLSEK